MKSHGGTDGQQFLAEATERAGPVDEMDLENPVPRRAVGIELSEPKLVAMPNGKWLRGSRCVLVRKMPDEVPGGGRAELPAGLRGKVAHEIVERARGQIGRIKVMLLALAKGGGDVGDQLVLAGVSAQHIRAAIVGLPFVENRSEVEIHDVVPGHAPIGRLSVISLHGVRAAP